MSRSSFPAALLRWAGVIALIGLAIPAAPAASQTPFEQGVLAGVNGEVVVVFSDGSAVQPATPGVALGTGDRVATIGAAGATVALAGGVELELGGDTTLQILTHQTGAAVQVEIAQGSVIARLRGALIGGALEMLAGSVLVLAKSGTVVGLLTLEAAAFAQSAAEGGKEAQLIDRGLGLSDRAEALKTARTIANGTSLTAVGAGSPKQPPLDVIGGELGPAADNPSELLRASQEAVADALPGGTSDGIRPAGSVTGSRPRDPEKDKERKPRPAGVGDSDSSKELLDLGDHPPNDNFSDARDLSLYTRTTGTFTNATRETFEPLSRCGGDGGTVWFKVRPAQTGTFGLFFQLSGYRPVFTVYSGSRLRDLKPLGCGTSLSFHADAGQTYYVQVARYTRPAAGVSPAATTGPDSPIDRGEFDLRLTFAGAGPANDAFASAFPLTAPGFATGSLKNASVEPNEPARCDANDGSVWYVLVAPSSGTLSVTARFGSNQPDTLSVFTGPSLGALTQLGCDTERVTASVTAGQAYYVRASGSRSSESPFTITASMGTPPANDAFANAAPLAVPGTATGDTFSATVESGEPEPACSVLNATLWYRVVAPSTGTLRVRVRSTDTDFTPSVAIFEGPNVRALRELACGGGSFSSTVETSGHVTAGGVYYAQVGRTGESSGAITVETFIGQGPPNDDFATAFPIGNDVSVDSPFLGATIESHEPTDCVGFRGSIWFRITAPQTGALSIFTGGPSGWIAVYSGTTLGNLKEVACGIGGVNALLVPGQAYFVQISGVCCGPEPVAVRTKTLAPPINDSFEGAFPIGVGTPLSGDTRSATRQLDEPGECIADPTVWYKLVAPTSGTLVITLQGDGQAFPRGGLFVGSAVGNLDPLGCGTSLSSFRREIRESVTAGVLYYIQATAGNGTFSGTSRMEVGPPNDDFSTPSPITVPGSFAGDTKPATSEFHEPNNCASGDTLWYRFVAPSSGTLEITLGQVGTSRPRAGLFEGTSINRLTQLACAFSSATGAVGATGRVLAGQTYFLQISSGLSEGGQFTVSLAIVGAPVNDQFANAFPITVPGKLGASFVGATTEPREPLSCSRGPSVWYALPPLPGGLVRFDVADGTAALSLYAGTSLDDLRTVRCGFDDIEIDLVAGQRYFLQVSRLSDSPPAVTIDVSFAGAPPNDNMDNAQPVAASGSYAGSVAGSTREGRESAAFCGSGGTVWYRFSVSTASVARVTARTSGGADLTISAYSSLPPVAASRLGCGSGAVEFAAKPGAQIWVQVSASFAARTDPNFTLTIDLIGTPPINDDFAAAYPLPVGQAGAADLNNATSEPSEPAVCVADRRTVWFWTVAPASGSMSVQAPPGAGLRVGVFRGGDIYSLQTVACLNGGGTFAATAGERYYLQLSGTAPTAVNIAVSFAGARPANDDRSNATALTLPIAIGGSTVNATRELNEPQPFCGGSDGPTVWYRFSAPASGTLHATTASSSFDTVVALYEEFSTGSIAQVGCNDDEGGGVTTSRLLASVRSDSAYLVQVSGKNGATGALILNLTLDTSPTPTRTPSPTQTPTLVPGSAVVTSTPKATAPAATSAPAPPRR
ncbi:MAG: hypothetical protein U0821_27870 [Chloroflexota bacterium]